MSEQRTLVLVKPDGVKAQHIGDIITRIEHKGYKIEALKMINATKEQLAKHYQYKGKKDQLRGSLLRAPT